MKITKILWITVGMIALVLGTIGVFLPILPTVPFYMLTVFAFAQSSEKLHSWFTSTNLYKKHLESYVEKKGMTVKTKCTILISVTILMGIGFFMMKSVPVGRIILAVIWIAHIIYFGFMVKTISKEEKEKMDIEKEEAKISKEKAKLDVLEGKLKETEAIDKAKENKENLDKSNKKEGSEKSDNKKNNNN